MSKVKTVVCDVCGDSVYQHARPQYQIRSRFFETDTLWKRMDLCHNCWLEFEHFVQDKRMGKNESDV